MGTGEPPRIASRPPRQRAFITTWENGSCVSNQRARVETRDRERERMGFLRKTKDTVQGFFHHSKNVLGSFFALLKDCCYTNVTCVLISNRNRLGKFL